MVICSRLWAECHDEGERDALSLLWAVLDRAAAGWRGIAYTPADVRLLQAIRRNLGLTHGRRQPGATTHPGGRVAGASAA